MKDGTQSSSAWVTAVVAAPNWFWMKMLPGLVKGGEPDASRTL